MVQELQVAVVTTSDGFEGLKEEWGVLLAACPESSVFQSHEWLYSWWLELGRHLWGRSLYVVTVRSEDGTLVGVAPLMTSSWHGTPLRRLSFLGSGVSDYHDLIAHVDCASAVSECVYKFLASSRVWAIGDFSQLREGGLWRGLPPGGECGLVHSDHDLEKCPYLPFPDGQGDRWPLVLQRYSKKMRSHIGYYERKLRAIYEVQAGYIRSPRELGDAMDALFELHRRRWNKRWLPGVLGGARMQAFHRRVASQFLGRGWLRLHYILLDGEFQALLYCFAYGDRTCYYQGGFEPTLAKLSLGSVLTAFAMRGAIDEGCSEFDFLRGDEPYKQRWTQGTCRVNQRRLMVRTGSPLLALAQFAHGIENAVEMRFKDFMHHVYASKGRQGQEEGASH